MALRPRWIIGMALGPGLAVGLAVIAYGWWLRPPTYAIPAWRDQWSEPGMPPGLFRRWRVDPAADATVVGETEPWPHKHPRANAYLLHSERFAGDVSVSLRARFERGRYLGVYLCFDPVRENGYWIATGHAVGENAGMAYIKRIAAGRAEVIARAPLALEPGVEYSLRFARAGERIELWVNDKLALAHRDDRYHAGEIRLRLHNAKVALGDVRVDGQPENVTPGPSPR